VSCQGGDPKKGRFFTTKKSNRGEKYAFLRGGRLDGERKAATSTGDGRRNGEGTSLLVSPEIKSHFLIIL